YCLGNGGGVVIHEGANRKFVDNAEASLSAGALLSVELFAIARKPVGDPNVAGTCREHGISKPLRGNQARNRALGGFRLPEVAAEEKDAGGGEVAQGAFR